MPAEKALHRQRLTRDLGAVFPGINIILDQEALLQAARHSRPLITVEEHSVYGGMGSAVAEMLSQEYPVPIKIMGIPDVFGQSAREYQQLLDKYGLTEENIIKEAAKLR